MHQYLVQNSPKSIIEHKRILREYTLLIKQAENLQLKQRNLTKIFKNQNLNSVSVMRCTVTHFVWIIGGIIHSRT